MRYCEILPPPALQDFVRFFWVLEQDDTTIQPHLYKLFAEGAELEEKIIEAKQENEIFQLLSSFFSC